MAPAKHGNPPPGSFEQTLGDAFILSEGSALRLATEDIECDKFRPMTGKLRQGRNSARRGTVVQAVETAQCVAPSGASVSTEM